MAVSISRRYIYSGDYTTVCFNLIHLIKSNIVIILKRETTPLIITPLEILEI